MTEAARPGWGILSTGWIADRFTTDLQDAGLRVAAVGSRTTERARAFAHQHGIPAAHGSWEALAADPSVDVVYVATPHSSHADAARVALEHGKHVLIEKPFTLNAGEAERLLTLAADRGLIALEAMWTRWLPHMIEVRRIIASGEIGDPQLLIVDHTQALPDDPHHRLNDPSLGGGALLDLGVYPVSFGHDLFGEPEEIVATAAMTATGVDQRVSGTLVHAGGAHTVFTAASNVAGPNRAAIVGTRGSIDIDATWYTPTSFTIRNREKEIVRTVAPAFEGIGMQYQAIEVERLIADGRTESESLTGAQTVAVMRTLDRIRATIGLVYPGESAG